MIDWAELFQMQKELDERIIREHGLEEKDLMPERITAFLVELSEFANEARFFKFWSNDQEPRRRGKYLGLREHVSQWSDPLLEEFVDALHFAIGIGLELGETTFFGEFEDEPVVGNQKSWLFLQMVSDAHEVALYYANDDVEYSTTVWRAIMQDLCLLGRSFGLTDDEIVTAYKSKHAENHHRQDVGY